MTLIALSSSRPSPGESRRSESAISNAPALILTKKDVMSTPAAPSAPKRNVLLRATPYASRASTCSAAGSSLIAADARRSLRIICRQLGSLLCGLSVRAPVPPPLPLPVLHIKPTSGDEKRWASCDARDVWNTAPAMPTPKTCPMLLNTNTKPVAIAISASEGLDNKPDR